MGDRGYGFEYLIAIVLLYGIVVEAVAARQGQAARQRPGREALRGGADHELVDSLPPHQLLLRTLQGEHFQGLHDLAACVICANKLRAARAEKRPATSGRLTVVKLLLNGCSNGWLIPSHTWTPVSVLTDFATSSRNVVRSTKLIHDDVQSQSPPHPVRDRPHWLASHVGIPNVVEPREVHVAQTR